MTDPPRSSPTDDDRLRAAIESTALGAAVQAETVDALCRNAVKHGLRAVCVPPAWVQRVSRNVEGSSVRVVTVANFPFGHALPSALEAEARVAREAGADEVDVVFPLHCVRARDWARAEAVLDAFGEGLAGLAHKVILETAAWTRDELDGLIAFVRSRTTPTVKTSTGFHPAGGVTIEVIRRLRRRLPDPVRIKASGGIRSREFALDLLDAGADSLGTSSATDLVEP